MKHPKSRHGIFPYRVYSTSKAKPGACADSYRQPGYLLFLKKTVTFHHRLTAVSSRSQAPAFCSRPQAPAWGRIFLRQAPLGDRYVHYITREEMQSFTK